MAYILTKLIFRNIKNLNDANFREKYGTLYTPCEITRGRWPLIFIMVFIVRRILISLSVGLFIDNPLAQLLMA